MYKIINFLSVIALILLIFLNKASYSYGSTIYSNDFTTSVNNYSQYFGLCNPSPQGLNCTTDGAGLLYNSLVNNPVCISADFKDPQTKYSALYLVDNNTNWLNNPIAFRAYYNGHLELDSLLSGLGTSISQISTPAGKHNYMLCKDGNTFNGYLDNNLVVSFSETGHLPKAFALSGSPNSPITNLIVTDSLPTPTPTPIQLSVTPLKQTDPLWKNMTYDMANIWSPTNPSIGTWGCALTSATMVLNYYNIHLLPGFGNTTLNPTTLDAWLNTQPDGYIPNGNVNWLAIARLTKQAKTNNPNFPFDALEYNRINSADTTTLLADLQKGQPDILEEPGHFVVATGQNGNTYTINDPFNSYTDLTTYGNSFLSLGRYIPSFTDLSYLLFYTDPNLTVVLKDNNGNPIGTSYLQQPLKGDGTSLIAGPSINELYLEQPVTGNYTLTVSGNANQLYTVKGYLYDKDGNVKPFSQTGVTGPNDQNTVSIHFDNQNLSNDTTQKVITISTFLNDLSTLYKLHEIKTGAYESLKNLGENIQKQIQKHNVLVVKIDLEIIHGLLDVDKKVGLLNNSAYPILHTDIQYLQTHL